MRCLMLTDQATEPEVAGGNASNPSGKSTITLEGEKQTENRDAMKEPELSPPTPPPKEIIPPPISKVIMTPAPALRTYKSDSSALKSATPSNPAKYEDPLKAYRIPSRTKVTMTALLNRMPGYRSPASSPAAFKNSRRAVSKLAPLHPNRKTPPPPPPRVKAVEKKSKAQRDEEERWEEEWEETYGDAWYEMSESDKNALRREKRDAMWVED